MIEFYNFGKNYKPHISVIGYLAQEMWIKLHQGT